VSNTELKAKLDLLSPQELKDIGYVKLETYISVTKTFTDAFSDFTDIITKWSINVAVQADRSKNANILVFAKVHLGNLKDAVSQRLAKLGANENH